MAETKYSVELTDQNFEEQVLKSDKPVLVDFWAEWCGPCIAMSPMIEELAQEYEGRAVIGKLNVDTNGESAMAYGIRSIPSLFIFKNGELVDKQIGKAPKATLKDKIDAQLA